jgi:hypothetical protein
MTVNSIVHLMAPRPFSINAQKQFVYVTEVWKLSNDVQVYFCSGQCKINLIRRRAFLEDRIR